jgi:hypothetical protein
MSLDIENITLIDMADEDIFLVFDDSELFQPKGITGAGLKEYIGVELDNIIDNLSGSYVELTGNQSILGIKTFEDNIIFNSIITLNEELISNHDVDFSSATSVELPASTNYDGNNLGDLLDLTNYTTLDSDQDISGVKTFQNGIIIEKGSGSVDFPQASDINIDGTALSDLIDLTNYTTLDSNQDITGFKTFKNGLKIEEGTGSVEFPDKDNVLFNNISLTTILQDAGNLIDVSDFVVTADLDDYVQTTDLDDYATLDDIDDFVNNSTFNTALTNYVDLENNQNISGVKTFQNGLTIEKGTGSIELPEIGDVNFDGVDLETILDDYITDSDLVTELADYVTNSSLTTTLSSYTLTADSLNEANCIVETGTTFTLTKSTHHNKKIYFDISADCTVSLDPSEADWSGFQCEFIVYDSTDTFFVDFNFTINDGDITDITGDRSNLKLHYCSNLSVWTAYLGNF